MPVSQYTPLEERVLVVMPNLRDTQRAVQLLGEADVKCVACSGLHELCAELRSGAGALLLADELMRGDGERLLEAVLREQPPWSTVPIIVLAAERSRADRSYGASEALRGVIIAERPVRARSLVSIVRSALRARRNQYEIREAIRERERQASARMAQDEKLRFALSAGGLGWWELDLANEELTCSEICKATYGRPLDQPFTYAQLLASIHPEDAERVTDAVARSMADNGFYDIEYRVVWPNGELHWVMIRGHAVRARENEPARMVGVSLDVTERERLHDALRLSQAELANQAEQLRTADRLKDEFLATLAHELRNPLAPITTGLALLSETADPKLSHKTLGVMQRQVSHMVRLIDDLLDVSRITSGKLELKRERISLASVLDAAIEGSMPNIERAGHTLRTSLTSEPLFLDADHTRVAQVISNLLNNSTKYTPRGGSIELAARRSGEFVVITVTDDGLGIPPDRLEEVFEMFSQVNRALERSQGGLGIGLALVRTLVQMHGGSVEARSAGRDQGSVFTVRLPLAAADVPVNDRPVPHAVRGPAATRILVVDDNDDAAELLSLMLRKAGHETVVAPDGQSALAAAEALVPDFVILDIGLPGMSGYQVAEQLRKNARYANAGLIALTGWGTPEDRRKALEVGFDVHLTKPVAPADLHDAMQRAALTRQRPPAAAAPAGQGT
jgi:signal transduction histidine kinase/DNA-binding response OmpR family regulator